MNIIEAEAKRGKIDLPAAKFSPRDCVMISRPRRKFGAARSTALQLEALKNQLPVAQAVTGESRMQAQYYATINTLLDQGKTLQDASAVASAQYTASTAQANASVAQQTQAVKDQTEMLKARQNGTEAQTAASIAYKNAIQSGASASAAGALKAAVLAQYMEKAAQQAEAMRQAFLGANYALQGLGNAGQSLNLPMGLGGLTREQANGPQGGGSDTSTHPGNAFDAAFSGSGGSGGTIPIVMTYKGYLADPSYRWANVNNQPPLTAAELTNSYLATGGGVNYALQQLKMSSPDYQSIDALYQLKNSQTDDKTVQAANLQEELAWFQSLPETLARDQQIVRLMDSIKQLKGAVDANTAATLNPLYSSGHGALAIGYYKAAGGLDGIVQGGTPGVDSVPFHAMLTPGERVIVLNDAQQRQQSGGEVRPAPAPPVVVQNFDFRGAQSNSRRSMRAVRARVRTDRGCFAMKKDVQTRAREHAHLAAAQSRMKSIPAADAGVAFMAHGLIMIYGIPLLQAFETVKILLPHAYEHLKRDIDMGRSVKGGG